MAMSFWTIWVLLQALPSCSGAALENQSAAGFREEVRATVAGNGQQQDQGIIKGDFSLKINVDMVTVEAVVRNDRGAIVSGLQADDFVIYDNGIAQEVTYFSRDQLPIAVALVIDRSPSIEPFLQVLRNAAMTALAHLRPEDQVVLFSFDADTSRLTNLLEDHAPIVQKIGKIKIGNGTNIYDAIYDAANYLRKKAPDRRRAIIMISDNYHTFYYSHDEKGALRELLESAVTLCSIRVPGNQFMSFGGRGFLATTSPSTVNWIAGETGGEVLNARNAAALSRALDSAVANLKLQYTLGFTPFDGAKNGSYHRLEVKLNPAKPCPECRVQARSGYYARVQ